jgi:hypothetical protein
MLKILAIAALLGGISIFAAFAGPDSSMATKSVGKLDRVNMPATSSARNYMSPRMNGRPVAFCMSLAKQCGKHAADAFCRGKGFDQAISYERDAFDPTNLSFRQIKCRQAREIALMAPSSSRLDPSLVKAENVTVLVKNQVFPPNSANF